MSNCYYDGEVWLTINDKEYCAIVQAEATYSSTPGRMYMANGDPGYPDEEEFDIDSIDARWFDDENNEVNATSEMEIALERWLYDNSNEFKEF